jgi:regulator of protease activity HflC (stomatin/prohibitin superfamily)
MILAELIIAAVVALFVVITVMRSVRIVPQARARNVERFGRYRKTLEPGMNFIIPFIDRVKPLIDLREQVVSFRGQHVITEDNLVVLIDTVLFFQVTDPRAADYEIVDYIQAIEQITATMLRSVIGSMDLEQSLTSRDKINNMLRGVLDEASGKWGIRVTRVEIKAIDPPQSVKDAMEKQMRAEREKRAAILTAEGVRQSKILTAEGEKQSAILSAEGARQSAILRAEGQAQAIATVFQAVHDNDPDPKLLAYQYLQTLPQIAQGAGSTFWVIPSEVTSALRAFSSAFGGAGSESGAVQAGPPDVKGLVRREPAAAETPAVSTGPPASEISAAPGNEMPALGAGPVPDEAPTIGAVPAAVTDAVSAMLAAAIPGTEFGDPLGSVGSGSPVNSVGIEVFGDIAPDRPSQGDQANARDAASATASLGTDTSAANGSEAAS